MVARVTVVLLDSDSVRLADDVSIRGQHPGEGVPDVGVENTTGQVPDFVVEPPERCSITTAYNPGDGSPASTIQGLDDPPFVFFDPMKCHISSNSISRMDS